jgi:hypothetical protein
MRQPLKCGNNNTDKENKMARYIGTMEADAANAAKKAAKKKTVVAKSADAARAQATAKNARPKRPMGELPKRMSGFAKVIAQDYPELGKSGAAALAGKITKEFVMANRAAAAKMKTDKASKKAK